MKTRSLRSFAIFALVISVTPAFADFSYCPALVKDLVRPDSQVGAAAVAYLSSHLKAHLDDAVSADKFQFMPLRVNGADPWKHYPKGRFDQLDPMAQIAISDLLTFAQVGHPVSEPWAYFLIHHAYDAIGPSIFKDGFTDFSYKALMKKLSDSIPLADVHPDDSMLKAYVDGMPRYAAVIEGTTNLSTAEKVKATEDIIDLMLGKPLMLIRDPAIAVKLPDFVAKNVDLIKQAKPAYSDDDIALLKLIAKSYAEQQ